MARVTWLADRLRMAGLTVIETEGWRTRERPGSFEPAGVLMHHTGFRSTDANPAPARPTVINGRSDLPGPLCHVLIDYRGRCHIIAAGRSNHAGVANASGPMPAGDGNTLYVGIEVDYAAYAVDPPQYRTSMQYSNSIVAAAAIVSRLGGAQRKVRGHKETSQTGKQDPWPWDMTAFRESVRQTLERTGW